MFDSTTPDKAEGSTLLLAYSLEVLPLVLLVSCIGGLISTRGPQTPGKIRAGKTLAWLPLLNIALFVISIVAVILVR